MTRKENQGATVRLALIPMWQVETHKYHCTSLIIAIRDPNHVEKDLYPGPSGESEFALYQAEQIVW